MVIEKLCNVNNLCHNTLKSPGYKWAYRHVRRDYKVATLLCTLLCQELLCQVLDRYDNSNMPKLTVLAPRFGQADHNYIIASLFNKKLCKVEQGH